MIPNWQLARVDRMTMAHSQEARVPFLDQKMVEFSAAIPVHFKQKTLDGKYIMKKAFKGILPEEILKRPKQGFTTPRNEWIMKDLKDMAFDLLSESNVKKRGIFDYRYIEKLKSKIANMDDRPFRPYSYKLMMLAMFELWQQIYIDDAIIF